MKSTLLLLTSIILGIAARAIDVSRLKAIQLVDSLQCKSAEPIVLECADYLLSRPCIEDDNESSVRNFLYAWMIETPEHHFYFNDPLFLAVQKDSMLSGRYMACQAKVALSEAGGISNRDFKLKYIGIFLEYCSDPRNKTKLPADLVELEHARRQGRLNDVLVANNVNGLRRIIDTTSSDSIKLLYLTAISNTYRDVNPDSMVYYAQQVVYLSMKNEGSFSEGAKARALTELGSALWYTGNYPEAKETYFKALAQAEAMNDTMLMGWVYNGLAMVNRNEGDLGKAIRYSTKAEQLTRHITDNDVLLDALTYKGKAYEQLDMLDSAYAYTRQALDMQLRKYRGRNIVGGTVQANMGIIYSKMGKVDTATAYFRSSFRLSNEVGDQRRLARAYCEYAEHLSRYEQPDSAIYYATKGLVIDKEHRFLVQQLAASTLLTKLYTAENKIDSAFKYQQLMVETRDSLFSREKINRLQTLEFNEQMRQQELEVARKAAEAQRRVNIQYKSIALGIIIFIILFSVLSRSFISSARWIEFFLALALLVTFEFVNMVLGPYIDRVTNQLPILVLLASVVVAVVLVPVHNTIEKWLKDKLVEKNKRVQQARAKAGT